MDVLNVTDARERNDLRRDLVTEPSPNYVIIHRSPFH